MFAAMKAVLSKDEINFLDSGKHEFRQARNPTRS